MRTTCAIALVAAVSATFPDSSGAQPEKTGPEFVAPAYTTYRQDIPRVCGQPGGDFVIVWTDDAGGYMQPADGRDGAGSGVFGRRFDAQSNPLSDDFAVNAYTSGSQRAVEVMCMDNGRFAVLWYQFPDGFQSDVPTRTKLATFESDGTPVSGEVGTPDVFTVATACEGPGNEFLVVYRDGLFYGQRLDDTAQLIGTEFDVRASQPYGELSSPACCGGDSGFVVVWHEYDFYGGAYEILARRLSSNGQSLGDAFLVNSYTTGDQRHADLDCNDDGSFVVVWQTEAGYGTGPPDGDGTGIAARRFDGTGTPLGDDFVVNEITDGDQYYPSVATDGASNFVVAWRFGTGFFDTSIHAQAFAPSGMRLGSEFQANTTAFDVMRNAAVGARAPGAFLLAWDAVNSGANDQDVLAQRISLAGVGPTTTTTTTSTTTTTMPGGGVCADPIALVYVEAGSSTTRIVTATDALFVLRAAVGIDSCALCVCDINGSAAITASDALLTLNLAVGRPVELMCPPCS